VDDRAFLEEAALDDARHLRPHFGGLESGYPSGQLGGDRHAARLHHHEANLRRPRRPAATALLATAARAVAGTARSEKQGRCKDDQARTAIAGRSVQISEPA
jgi:hypothetical protein